MTSALEDIKTIDLDQWLTLATAPSPTKLQPGQTPFAYNTWVDEKPGSVITANGFIKVGTLPSGNPGTFSINYFNTTAGTQIYVVSDNSTVWTTVDFQNFTQIITGLSAFFQLRGAVIRDKLWLTNGNDFVRIFDGTTVTILDGSLPVNLVFQDLTYALQPNVGISPTQVSIAYVSGGTAGSEIVTVSGSSISIQIQSGVSTANEIFTALGGSPAALAILSIAISGVGTNPQVAPEGPVFFSGGAPLAPKGSYIAYHDERVWLYNQPSARSLCAFSALSDANANEIAPDDFTAWNQDNTIQVSEGDADYGTGLLIYRGFLHFFKQYSIWRLVGYDEYSYTRVKTRASTGTRFNESLQIMDSLVHFIGIDGIYVFDGEETDRISDIIDPATAEQASFGFNQLQQPNQNNQFWEVESTADFNAGSIPQNLSISNAATLQAKDDSATDFQAAPTKTNIDLTANPGAVQLAVTSSGQSNNNVALQGIASIISAAGNSTVGSVFFVNDGNLTNRFGYICNNPGNCITSILINIPYNLTTIVLKGFIATDLGKLSFTINGGTPLSPSSIVPSSYSGRTFNISGGVISWGGSNPSGAQDLTIAFPAFIANSVEVIFNNGNQGTAPTITIEEIQIFSALYSTTGQIVSRTLDLGDIPASLGNLFSDFVLNGEGLTFQTQTSPDGSTWDSAVSVANGAAIGSTPRRFLRWIGNFTSDGLNTPVLSDVWVGTLYESAIHDTGGSIFAWGAFSADYSLNAQTISFYYRGAASSGAVSSASWNFIVPGGAINLPITDRYIQFKFEISGLASGNSPPVVDSVTMNWITGTAGQPQVFQNVASYFWRNRYWLSAAGAGATSNNTILIRGKKTFQSPWQLKDWAILSFTRYLDNLYGTSSVDGSIYQLDTGFSKDGANLNSIFETGDFSVKGFQMNVSEIMLETQRLGPYTLFVGTSTDQGNTWTDHSIDLTLPTGGSLNIWKRINNLNLTTDKVRFRFYTNQADQPWQVHSAVIYYKLSAQRGTVGVN